MDKDREEAIIPASGPMVLARYTDGSEYPVVAWLIERSDYDVGTKDEGSVLFAEGMILQQGNHYLSTVTDAGGSDVSFEEYVYGDY